MCLQTYQRFASDSLKRCSWTAAEDALLKELVEKMRIGNFIPYTQSKDVTRTLTTSHGLTTCRTE